LQTQVLADRHEAVIECLLRAVVEKAETVSGEADADSPAFSLRLRAATIRASEADTPSSATSQQANADEFSANGALRLVWSSVIRLEMNENYYQLWYYDGEGDVQKTLVRKTDVPTQETMPPAFYKAHRSHIVNVRHVAEVNASSLLMRDGAMVPLAGSERQRLRNIVRETSVQMALLHELRGLVVEEQPRVENL
jgi:DNA-binding LytR/AlgR family response regulator